MNNYNSVLRYLYLVCFLFAYYVGTAQNVPLDTILLTNVKSSYPIVATTSDLQFVRHLRQWHYCYGVKSVYFPSFNSDTIRYFHTNQIYSNGYTISYLEKSGNIRLEYILLKKHKDFWLQFDGLKLCYKTSMEDLKKHFKYNDDDEDVGGIAPLNIGDKVAICKHYRLDFYTGETAPVKWHLVFDGKKRLIIVELEYDQFDAP